MNAARHGNRGRLMICWSACLLMAAAAVPRPAMGEDKADHKIALAEGQMLMTAPDSWTRKEPRVRIIDHEFAVPATKGDSDDGRVTIMGAGGEVEANIERWMGQFSQADGSETKNQVAEKERKTSVAGLDVYWVDIVGTYHDRAAPFDPNSKTVDRENYRMLAAIVIAPKLGNYFIKFYGPKQTVADHADEFRKMIAGLTLKK